MSRAWQFVRRVWSDFQHNQGLLLAGAVAYYTLLSIVPLFAVLLVALSHFVEQQRIIDVLSANLAFLVSRPSATAIVEQVKSFLEHRSMIGWVGGVALLFFSSFAFSVLEGAMKVIFHHRSSARSRHPLVSAVMPYLFIMLLGAGLLLVTAISGVLDILGRDSIHLFGHDFSLAGFSGVLLYLLGISGLSLMLTALYLVMPVGRIAFGHALVGGVTATALWEIVRHVLVWYFAHLSMVSIIYGSLATTIVVLLTLETAAIILLVGAQVIAEIDRRRLDPAAGAAAAA